MYSDDEILAVFRESDHPFLGTAEVQEAVGYSQQKGAYHRLELLVDEGKLEKKMVGTVTIYWLPCRVN